MPDTLGSMRGEVLVWLRGDLDGDDDAKIINGAINDANESIWMSMMLAKLNRFLGNDVPVSFQLPANAERVNLVAIVDPAGQIQLTDNGAGSSDSVSARVISAAFSYVTESGSETLVSPTQVINLAAGHSFFAQLPPPQANIAQAIGWNLYTGSAPDTVLALQNSQPIPFQVGWREPPTMVVDYPDAQQLVPVTNTTADNVSWIQHMEVRTSDGLLRSWNQASIDSMLFRQFGRILPTASEYQTYVWDLINGKQLEFRPMTGQAFTPRYFYIAKPRRLRYDQAELQYSSITGVHAFILNKAISKCKLALDEYLAHQAWGTLASEEQQKIISALTQEDWSRDTRITPHSY